MTVSGSKSNNVEHLGEESTTNPIFIIFSSLKLVIILDGHVAGGVYLSAPTRLLHAPQPNDCAQGTSTNLFLSTLPLFPNNQCSFIRVCFFSSENPIIMAALHRHRRFVRRSWPIPFVRSRNRLLLFFFLHPPRPLSRLSPFSSP